MLPTGVPLASVVKAPDRRGAFGVGATVRASAAAHNSGSLRLLGAAWPACGCAAAANVRCASRGVLFCIWDSSFAVRALVVALLLPLALGRLAADLPPALGAACRPPPDSEANRREVLSCAAPGRAKRSGWSGGASSSSELP